VTSGLDGKFVPGLPVARIESVEPGTDAFARIICQPLGGVERSTKVLVLSRAELPPPLPKPETGEPPPPPPMAVRRDPGNDEN
jgi:rod shape-determining protein MreC